MAENKNESVLERCSFIWQQNFAIASNIGNAVLERCSFIWQQNFYGAKCFEFHVLERCSFIWQQNRGSICSHYCEFQNDVVSYGSKICLQKQYLRVEFQNDVVSYGSKISIILDILCAEFQNDVVSYGSKIDLGRFCTYLLYMTIQFYTAICLPSSTQYIERLLCGGKIL